MAEQIPRESNRVPGASGTADGDAWEKAVSMRHVTSLLTGFHKEVTQNIPGAAISPEMFDAWWNAVEQRDWELTVQELDWLIKFLRPVRVWLGWRKGHEPPMVRKLAPLAEVERRTTRPDGAKSRSYFASDQERYSRFVEMAVAHLNSGYEHYSVNKLATEAHVGKRFGRIYAQRLIQEDSRFARFFRFLQAAE